VSVKELKKVLASLSVSEQAEVAALLFRLCRKSDPEYQATIQRRLDDKDSSHWLTPHEVVRPLTKK
jgi:hypothetical protein